MADLKIDFNGCDVRIEKMFDIHDNGTVSIHTGARSSESDTRSTVIRAIEATAEKAHIRFKNEYLAIYQIIVERHICSNLSKIGFCRMTDSCRVDVKPHDRDFKNIMIRGLYPNWDADNGKGQRYVEIARTFMEAWEEMDGGLE